MKTLFMETTKIEPEQTVTEIQRILGKYGASAVMTEYEKGEIVSVTFKIKLGERWLPFLLPCRWQPVHKNFLLRREGGQSLRHKIADDIIQAKRVAWRQILRWIEAQMALVETEMVDIKEVFMPYIQVSLTQTFYQKMAQKGNFPQIEDQR